MLKVVGTARHLVAASVGASIVLATIGGLRCYGGRSACGTASEALPLAVLDPSQSTPEPKARAAFDALWAARSIQLRDRGGRRSEYAVAFQQVLHTPNAAETFQRLLDSPHAAARLYGLSGLYLTDRPAFGSSFGAFLFDRTEVEVRLGSAFATTSAESFVAHILTGAFPRELREVTDDPLWGL